MPNGPDFDDNLHEALDEHAFENSLLVLGACIDTSKVEVSMQVEVVRVHMHA